MFKRAILVVITILVFQPVKGQLLEPADEYHKGRTIGTSAFLATGWIGSISGLYYVWYKDFPSSGFHTFDDSHQWNQMDKMGHLTSSWYMARISGDLYEWSGIDHKTAAIIGTSFSMAYMTSFEILDGTSDGWGFSWSDMGFNALGALTYGVQEYFWDEQFFKIKFSAHNSGLADYRPTVLGADPLSRVLKDYNGQTYWASFNPVHWFDPESKVPKWITFSIGYSTQDQLFGDGSTYVVNNGATQQSYVPYRQLFFSFDIDFEELPFEAGWIRLIMRGINIIKFPFPALEVSQGGVQFHPFYF